MIEADLTSPDGVPWSRRSFDFSMKCPP